jgi:hypothetical protein
VPMRLVSIRDPEGGFEPQALLCTDLEADPERIVSWYVMRWQLEVRLQEARRHLGFETQRQCSEMAIRRTTPALMGLFSVLTCLSVEVVRKPPKLVAELVAKVWAEEWAKEGKRIDWRKLMPPRGYVALPRRWVVERTFSWLSQNRRMSKDYERLCASAEAFIYAAMIRLMVRRLVRA